MKPPFRTVVSSELVQNRVAQWLWNLNLECGHTMVRPARYKPETARPSPGARHWFVHDKEDVMSPPKKSHCLDCREPEL